MSGKSPRERLHKLFHRHDDASKSPDATPPASPTSPRSRDSLQNLRKAPSSTQMYSKGLSDTKRHSRKISTSVDDYDTPNGAQLNGSPAAKVPVNGTPSSSSAGAQIAAQTAVANAQTSNHDMGLPSIPRQTDLSSEFGDLTLSKPISNSARSSRPLGQDGAKGNVGNLVSRFSQDMDASARPTSSDAMPGRGSFEQRSRPNRRSVGNAQALIPEQDKHSEDVAARNITPSGSARRDVPQPLDVKKSTPLESKRQAQDFSNVQVQRDLAGQTTDKRSLSRKQDVSDLRRSSDASRSDLSGGQDSRRSLETDRRYAGRSSMEKPLPSTPINSRGLVSSNSTQDDAGVHSELGKERGYLIKDSEKPVALSGIVDLRNTEDTTLHERWAPAVTHEVVTQNVHEIREEVITREIHEYHHLHRILPIVDIEILPARHFTPVEGGYVEIAEEEVPGRAGPNAQWVIAETVSRMLPKSTGQLPIRQFTARKFEGTDGDYKEYTTADGIKRTETWWVHPPTIETGGMETGQTYPFYLGHPDPAQNGLRAHLPAGNLVGVSPMLAKKQRERQGGNQQLSETAAPPAVPPHKIFPADLVDSTRAGPTAKYSR